MDLAAVKMRLRRNGRRLEVMLGYSDSSKEAGVLAASLTLYEAQCEIAAWARERDIELTIFHGRGGALGRGGGPTARAIRAQPPGTVDGRFKVTEQGEVAFARHGDPDIAWHHLEQLARAVAGAPGTDAPDPSDDFATEIETMRTASERAWRTLVGAPGFARCVTRATPIKQISSMPIASRPVSRTSNVEDLDALRAIPWVFSWAQARVNLPGWFGLGTGLETVATTRGGLNHLRGMHRTWPFFAVLLENASVSLAKADRALAARYLARADQPEQADVIFAEWDRTERTDPRDHRRGASARRARLAPQRCPSPRPVRRRAVLPSASVPRRPKGDAVGASDDRGGRGRPAEHRLTCGSARMSLTDVQEPGYRRTQPVPYAPALRPGRQTDRDTMERKSHG